MIVNAIKSISYNAAEVRDTIAELNQIPIEDVPMEEAINIIRNFIVEDFGDSYGVILLDENGEEL